MAYNIEEYHGRSAAYLARRSALAESYLATLKAKGFTAEINDDDEIVFSLTPLGLEGVWTTIGLNELEYHLDNDEGDEA